MEGEEVEARRWSGGGRGVEEEEGRRRREHGDGAGVARGDAAAGWLRGLLAGCEEVPCEKVGSERTCATV